METHVCILQTALHRLAAERAILTGSESLLFELLRSSESPRFKEISDLVK